MQRQVDHVRLGDPTQFSAFDAGHDWQQPGRVQPVPTGAAVTTETRRSI
jgi:hypothetical protein